MLVISFVKNSLSTLKCPVLIAREDESMDCINWCPLPTGFHLGLESEDNGGEKEEDIRVFIFH